MCSKFFVPRALTSALFLTFSFFSAYAQSHSLGEAWKTSTKSPSEVPVKISDAVVNAKPEAILNNQNQVQTKELSAAPNTTAAVKLPVPIEPNVKPANPGLNLEKEVSVVNAAKLATDASADFDLVGLDPPRAFQATAYSLRGRTRMGTYVRRGVIAADPRVLPLGSVVQLKAGHYSGVYTVHDTGDAIKGKKIDVWMPSSREARSFGRQNIKLVVLKYGGRKAGKAAKSKK